MLNNRTGEDIEISTADLSGHERCHQALGKLEREVLNEIWRREEGVVRDVYWPSAKSIVHDIDDHAGTFSRRTLTRQDGSGLFTARFTG